LRNKSLPLNTYELAVMDESVLRNMLGSVRRALSRTKDRNVRRDLELNACYLYREIEIRENRRKMHQQWISNKKGVA
jgi:hypothetical protein